MKHSLLIVDDEPLTREYFKRNLAGVSEHWAFGGEASDGAEALELFRRTAADLIVTDIKMPVMDGLELSRQARQERPEQKILILSGYDEFALARQAIQYGVSDYLLKPIAQEQLRDALEKIHRELEAEQKPAINETGLNAIWKAAHAKSIPKETVSALFSDILCLYDPSTGQAPSRSEEQRIIQFTKEYVEAHFFEPISLAEIADRLGLNPSYLSNLFHQATGEPYIKFLTRLRMEKAAGLLRKCPGLRLADISEKVGYASVKHFSRAFKEYFFVTPGEFRRGGLQP